MNRRLFFRFPLVAGVFASAHSSIAAAVAQVLSPGRGQVLVKAGADCDEWFFVRDGEFKFKTGDEILHLQAGDSLFVPRNMPHAFVKISESTARLIVMHQPAGTMEEYFRTASKFTNQSPEQTKSFAEKHGMRILGPALTAD
jgi:mannose-6-phosphate isomerase-like protein (cupin superfamily)